jgi:hypothetical protein
LVLEELQVTVQQTLLLEQIQYSAQLQQQVVDMVLLLETPEFLGVLEGLVVEGVLAVVVVVALRVLEEPEHQVKVILAEVHTPLVVGHHLLVAAGALVLLAGLREQLILAVMVGWAWLLHFLALLFTMQVVAVGVYM